MLRGLLLNIRDWVSYSQVIWSILHLGNSNSSLIYTKRVQNILGLYPLYVPKCVLEGLHPPKKPHKVPRSPEYPPKCPIFPPEYSQNPQNTHKIPRIPPPEYTQTPSPTGLKSFSLVCLSSVQESVGPWVVHNLIYVKFISRLHMAYAKFVPDNVHPIIPMSSSTITTIVSLS